MEAFINALVQENEERLDKLNEDILDLEDARLPEDSTGQTGGNGRAAPGSDIDQKRSDSAGGVHINLDDDSDEEFQRPSFPEVYLSEFFLNKP